MAHHRTGYILTLVLLIVTLLLSACAANRAASSKESSTDAEISVDRVEYERLISEVQKLRQELERRGAEVAALTNQMRTEKALEKQMAELKLRVVEKDTHVEQLQQRQDFLQNQFDDAIQEVVRAKARLRSLESKAEAASNMAETEIALKTIRTHYPGAETDPEISQAEHLLTMSTEEFEKENFGGALYLAIQAASIINSAKGRLIVRETGELRPGEVPFAVPLSLSVNKVSNIRQGPGFQYPVVGTLLPDTLVTGFARKGEWVRVTDEYGLSGWIYQTLVTGQ
ncbi:hypothetical protein D3OALGA1CA_4774 [Olavius algarvensis associated proteobacterium Delta 3]|nr:hypothetical protein D3OALGB2SA_2048 [Olavius algarvensis associated proteobacterium Delta 3]CAB5156685.1 hypothetical protein D3OALGA1CA_4774 [Olavius algarvensis associated proteobacterium Delta 3]